MQHTRGRYILIFPTVLITAVMVQPRSQPIAVYGPVSHYPPFEKGYYNMNVFRMFSTSVRVQCYSASPYGECLHASIKYSTRYITCLPIKKNNIIHIKCALVFCDEFHEYNIPDEELDGGPNASLIRFSVYTYQVGCATRGILPNGPSVCIIYK